MVDTPTVERLGRYRLLRRLGRGGMATVYHAVQEGPLGFENEVAVKVVHPELLDEHPFLLQNLVDEARIAARIRHPNVVRILDLVEEGERFYLVMDYVDGVSMRQVLDAARATKTPPATAPILEVLSLAARGLDAAHRLVLADGTSMGLVHRDMKPGNILVSHDGQVKVSDFGVALFGDRITESTMIGQMKGTPAYMSPEQALGDPVSGRSDIFSLGVTLFTLLTTRLIHQAESALRLALKMATEPIERQADELEVIAPGLGDILRIACARNPEERYPDAAQLGRALEAVRATLDDPTTIADMVTATGWTQHATGLPHIDRDPSHGSAAPLLGSRPGAVAPGFEESLQLDPEEPPHNEEQATVAGAPAPVATAELLGPSDGANLGEEAPRPPGDEATRGRDQPSPASDHEPSPGRDRPSRPSDDEPTRSGDRPSPASDDEPTSRGDQPSPASDHEPTRGHDEPSPASDDEPTDADARAPIDPAPEPTPDAAKDTHPEPTPDAAKGTHPAPTPDAAKGTHPTPPRPPADPSATVPPLPPDDDPERTPVAAHIPPMLDLSADGGAVVIPDPNTPNVDIVLPPRPPPGPRPRGTGLDGGLHPPVGPLGPLPRSPVPRSARPRPVKPSRPARDYRGRALSTGPLEQNTTIGRAEKLGVAAAFVLLLLAVATIVGLQILRPSATDQDPRVADGPLPPAAEVVGAVEPGEPVAPPPGHPSPPPADGSLSAPAQAPAPPAAAPPPQEADDKAVGEVIEPTGEAPVARPGELVPGAVVEHRTRTLNDRVRAATKKKEAASPREEPSADPADVAPGTLVVNSYPYSNVFVDGEAIGTTPVRGRSIPAGPHEIKLVFPSAGGAVHVQQIDVKPGQKATVIKKLDPT